MIKISLLTNLRSSAAISRMIYNIRGKFMNRLRNDRIVSTCNTLLSNVTIDDRQRRFRVITLGAEDKLADKAVKEIEEFVGIMRAIDDKLVGGHAHLGA